jgi:transposase
MAELTIPLDLPDVDVLKVEVQGTGPLIISVESTLKGTRCKRCGREIERWAGYSDWVQVRHLPSFGRAVYIRYRPKRYECPYCDGQPKTTQALAWHTPNSPYTRAYEDYILKALINSTVQDVSLKEQLGYDGVLGILERRVEETVDWSRLERLGVLGIDELAIRKGQRDYAVIISSRLADGEIVVLGVLPDRKKATVQAFLESIPARLRATLQSVCIDRYESYRQAVKAALPHAQVIIDRFHVVQHYADAADAVRKQEMARLKSTLPRADYQALKRARQAFRKHRATLTAEEQTALERLFSSAPVLRLVYAFREGLYAIFEQRLSKAQAQEQLQLWMFLVREQHIPGFDSFLDTLQRYWDEITNFFTNRFTSGFVEGLNNRIRVLLRRAFGLRNLTHLFQRLVLDLNGFERFA